MQLGILESDTQLDDDTFTSPWKIDTPVNLDGLTSRTIWQAHTPEGETMDGRLDTIRSWLQECKSNHPACTSGQLQLPTRLLDVGVEGDVSGIKLIDTGSLDHDGSDNVVYTALSHCWGSVPKSHCTTTAENEAERRENIEFDSLPKTYRDAVIVTRKLGVRYIWIDSLAIIQQNKQDWENECSHMSSVYQGAFLTIAATSAVDSNGGLFISSLEPPMQLQYRPDASPALVRCPAANVKSVTLAPLNSRAWTLQELVLSKRTVHFATDQLYWQCQTLLLSEDGLLQDDKFSSLRYTDVSDRLDFGDGAIAQEYWWMWVQDYSARKLSNRGDWLAALAGVTQHFAEQTGLTPCLGLWQESLVHDLGWSLEGDVDADPAASRRSTLANLPSWSWQRHEARIARPWIALRARRGGYAGPAIVTRATAEAGPRQGELHGVRWAGAPLASAVRRARLTLTGPVARLTFRRATVRRRRGMPLAVPREAWTLEWDGAPGAGVFWPDGPVAPVSEPGTFQAACMGLSTCLAGDGKLRPQVGYLSCSPLGVESLGAVSDVRARGNWLVGGYIR